MACHGTLLEIAGAAVIMCGDDGLYATGRVLLADGVHWLRDTAASLIALYDRQTPRNHLTWQKNYPRGEDYVTDKSSTSTVSHVTLSTVGVVIICTLSAPSWGQPTCSGPNLESHHLGLYNFDTNSRIEPANAPGYLYGIVSCVANKDSLNPLYIRWIIPGPHGWVPQGNTLESVPHLMKSQDPSQLVGCLQYGNRGDLDEAHFFGDIADQKQSLKETEQGCNVAAATESTAPGTVFERILEKIRNYFPSNAKDPRGTMLQLDAEAGVEIKEPGHYFSYVQYTIQRYGDSTGSVEGLSIRPAFSGVTESLLPAFRESHPDEVQLFDKNIISFVSLSG